MPARVPGQPFPSVTLAFVDGQTQPIVDQTAPFMTMIDVDRGLHCPRCDRHLRDIVAQKETFADLGVSVVAVSTDPEDRAREAVDNWQLGDVPVAFGLPIATAQSLGLAISSAIRDGETSLFTEPGVFFARADGTLHGSIVNTFPFARPVVSDLDDVAQVAKERNYPPRGTWTG
ncbi:MAG: redoxin domain-containing protein [Pseudomonadota bacterium]